MRPAAPIAVPTCRKPGGLCWALHEFSHGAEASGLGKWVAGSQFLARQESPCSVVFESSWSLGLQKPGPRLKPRNAFKTAASTLDSGTFQGATNIRVKARQTEKVGAKADRDWAPGRTAPAHWSTVSSGPHLLYSYNQRRYACFAGQRHSICRSQTPGVNGKQKDGRQGGCSGAALSQELFRACLSGNSLLEL